MQLEGLSSRSSTACSTTRPSGVSSGNRTAAGSGSRLDSGHWRRYGCRPLGGHGGRRSVPGQHHHRVGQRQHLRPQALDPCLESPPAGRPPDRARERTSPLKTSGSPPLPGANSWSPACAPAHGMRRSRCRPRKPSRRRSARGHRPLDEPGVARTNTGEQLPFSELIDRTGVGQQLAVVGMHPARAELARHSGATANMWSRCPWVYHHPRHRLVADAQPPGRDAGSRAHPRSITTHSDPRPGHHVGVGLQGPAGKTQRSRRRAYRAGWMHDESGRTWRPPSFVRVEADGTVYVPPPRRAQCRSRFRTYRPTRPWPSSPVRFSAPELEVNLLQTRIAAGALSRRRRSGLGPHGARRRVRSTCRG